MGDMGDYFNEVKNQRRRLREKYGEPCPECIRLLPKAYPSILLPGQVCKIHKYKDPRPRLHTKWAITDGAKR